MSSRLIQVSVRQIIEKWLVLRKARIRSILDLSERICIREKLKLSVLVDNQVLDLALAFVSEKAAYDVLQNDNSESEGEVINSIILCIMMLYIVYIIYNYHVIV